MILQRKLAKRRSLAMVFETHCSICGGTIVSVKTIVTIAGLLLSVLSSPAALSAQVPAQQEQPEFVKQAQQLFHDGKQQEALEVYLRELKSSPGSRHANLGAGGILDWMGKGEDARKHFAKAIEAADTQEHKAAAQRATAISYAFERNCNKAIEYEQQVFDFHVSTKNFFQQGEAADEGARICLDSGNLEAAQKWYKIGHDTGLKEPEIKPDRQDLWEFRLENAEARIAARRGDTAEAQKHVDAAKAILGKGRIPQQAQFLPSLKGYVAFYAKDYTSALAAYMEANQNDPFVQCMIGQSYEKLGQKGKASEYYHKAFLAASHNPPAAYAVPFARKKLG
jgi:tetratricopeptide (TPR) repeat protein